MTGSAPKEHHETGPYCRVLREQPMTTYRHTLVLSDDEASMLEAALLAMANHCELKMARRPGASLLTGLYCRWAWVYAQQMRKRVRLITTGYRGEGPRTSVSHTLVLDDNCMDALSQTLKLMIRNWERKLTNNENAPLRKWLYCAREVDVCTTTLN